MIKIHMKDKIRVLFIVLLVLLPLLLIINPIVQAEANSAIQIDSIEDLWKIRDNLSGYYILMKDLDFQDDASYDNTVHKSGNTTGNGWLPIGSENYEFTGTFDGKNYTISNLFVNRDDEDSIGLFGYTLDSTIININLIDIYVTGYEFVGGLIGFNMGNISNCSITGILQGDYNVGGLVGYNLEGSILDSYAAVNVHGENCVGGLTGSNIDSFVDNSYSNGDITGLTDYDNNMGGLIGYNNGTITNCYARGDVVSEGKYSWYIGGLVGENDEGSIANCYSTGYVDGSDVVGGLIGSNTVMVENCFWDKQTSGQDSSDGGTGKTTSEMKNFNTFNDESWDIAKIKYYIDETWFINHTFDYPRLGWESTSPLNYPPNIPFNPTPSNGKISVNINQDLYWNGGDPDINDIVSYDVYFSATYPPIKKISKQSSITYDPDTMNYGTTYYWQIVSWDTHRVSSSGPIWSFTTGTQSQGGSGGDDVGGGLILYPNRFPIANASASNKSGLINTPSTFNASYSIDEDGEITNYAWDFGDGSIGSGVITTHIYVKAGIYIVKLVVTDNEGISDIDSFSIIISRSSNAPTVPQINKLNSGKQNIEYSFTVFSTDPNNDAIKYIFKWGDGQTNETEYLSNGTIYVQTHKWTTSGIFKITVFAIDSNYVVSDSVDFDILIDVIYCLDFGYLIDKNSDGTYDLFYSNQTKTMTDTQKQDYDFYLLNYDEDSDWDYIYDPLNHTYSSYLEPSAEIFKDINIWIFALIIIVILSVVIIVIVKRKSLKKKLEELKTEVPQVEVSKVEEQKIQLPKIEVLKAEELGVQQPEAVVSKIEEPKIEEPITEEPVVEELKTVEQKVEGLLTKNAQVEETTTKEEKTEETKIEETQVEEPQIEEKETEEQRKEELKPEETESKEPEIKEFKPEESKIEEQKIQEQKIEELKTEDLGVKQPEAVVSKIEEPKIEEPITEEPQVEEQKTVEQKVEELITAKTMVEEPKEEPKLEEKETEEPEVKESEELKTEVSKVEKLKIEEAEIEEQKAEEKKIEEQKPWEIETKEPEIKESDELKTEESRPEEKETEEQKKEEPKSDQTETKETEVKQSEHEESKVEEQKTEEIKPEESKVEETKIKESNTDETKNEKPEVKKPKSNESDDEESKT